MKRNRLSIAAAVLTLAMVLACSGGPTPPARTPAQYFRDRQGATVTPHGKIRLNTVEEREGKIHYQTESGTKWRVGYTQLPDGTYQYGTPDEVK